MAPKTILLRGDPIYGEATATGAITPGMVVFPVGAIRTTSTSPTVAVAGAGFASPIFARENEIVGDGIDDAYATDDNVLYMHCRQGDHIYALLAAGQDVAAGANLSVGAGGTLVAATVADDDPAVIFPTIIIARALEAVDNNPGTGGAPVRIKVEIV